MKPLDASQRPDKMTHQAQKKTSSNRMSRMKTHLTEKITLEFSLLLFIPHLQDSDKYINVIVGTRVDNLAFQYYGDISLWWIIARANGLTGTELQLDTIKNIGNPINIDSILEEFTKLNG